MFRKADIEQYFSAEKQGSFFFLTVGICLFFYFRKNVAKQFCSGLGMGLFIMVVVALLLDVAAHRRAAVYTQALQAFINQKIICHDVQ